MALSTITNGNGPNNPANQLHKVRVLIGTMIASLGRDASVGEIVDISFDDFRFLNAYNFVTKDLYPDAVEETPEPETDEAPADDEDKGDETEENEPEAPKAPVVKTGKPAGKRK